MKILSAAQHTGGAKAILPVIKKLKNLDHNEIYTILESPADKVFCNDGEGYTHLSHLSIDNSPESMEGIIEKLKPNIILTGTSMPDNYNKYVIDQSIVQVANKLSIPSISILDFWGNYKERFSQGDSGDLYFMPTKVCVMDYFAAHQMYKEGFGKEKICITGNPAFDELEEKASGFTDSMKNQIKEGLGLTNDKYIFYASNVFLENLQEFGYWDMDCIDLMTNKINKMGYTYGIIVKMHPSQPDEDYRLIKNYADSINLTKDLIYLIEKDNKYDSLDIALCSDIVATPLSTLGIESIIMGIPVISTQPNAKIPDQYILSNLDAVMTIYSEKDSEKIFGMLGDYESFRKAALEKAKAFSIEKNATQKVINLIYETAESQ